MSGTGIRIVDMPDLGVVTDASSMVGELAGSGRFSAPAIRNYVTSSLLWTSVKDVAYGATGNGTTDDTAAINAALATGRSVIFPAGTYRVSGPLTVTAVGQMLWGMGDEVTTIRTAAATGDVLTVSGTDLDIGHIGFSASVARTGGTFINLGNSIQVRIHDFNMTAWYAGIVIGTTGTSGGHSIYIERGYIVTAVPNAFVGVACNCGVVTVLRDLLIEGNNVGGGELTAGVHIGAMGDITLDHVETIWAGTGCLIAPPPSTMAQCIFIVNSLFDTGAAYGIRAEANNSASIMLLMINTCWAASNTGGGISLATDATGVIQQTTIVNSVFSNSVGHGLWIGGFRVTNTKVVACTFSANTYSGIMIDPNTTHFQIIGCTAAASGQFTGNNVGITINSGCNHFTIADNDVLANASPINLGTLTAPPGVSYWIKNNTGFVTHNFGVLTTTAGPSSFAITHGLLYVPLTAQIRLTLNTGIGAATYFYASAANATTFAIVFNAPPGVGVVVAWEVRILGN